MSGSRGIPIIAGAAALLALVAANAAFGQAAALVGSVLYALAISLSLEKAKTPTNLLTGLVVGAIAGVLIWGTADFTQFAYSNVSNLSSTIADTLLEGVRGGIAGAILAIVGGLVSGKRAAA